jgi:anti-sigma B factor antagonist
MPTKFELGNPEPDGSRILKVSGEVDMESSPGLKDQILKALKTTRLLRIDLRDVSYLDSSGIAVLIGGRKEAQRAKIDYRLLDPSQQVKSVIELAMLHQFFVIESSGSGA